ARVIKAAFDAKDAGARYPQADLAENDTFYDDLVPIIIRILNVPGLPEDLVKAAADPRTAMLGQIMSNMFKYKDRFDIDPNTQAVIGSWRQPVDRTQSDSDYNRSAAQRLFHLVNDSNGVRFCSKAGAVVQILGIGIRTYNAPCELFQINDLGTFFI